LVEVWQWSTLTRCCHRLRPRKRALGRVPPGFRLVMTAPSDLGMGALQLATEGPLVARGCLRMVAGTLRG
jgi:hypothetical protein